MADADQCIICLEPLPALSSLPRVPGADATTPGPEAPLSTLDADADSSEKEDLNRIAALDGCDHTIHDLCIRSWAQKTNTCPICRTPFNQVTVFDGVDGPAVSSYSVQDKKQVAEFDVREWLDQNEALEEEESTPCPICNSAEDEEVLLLCDACDAPYHTYCVGLNGVPQGGWYCLECADLFGQETSDGADDDFEPGDEGRGETRPTRLRRRRGVVVRLGGRHSNLFPRTRGRERRARHQARSVEWQGPWGEITGRVFDGIDIDLDNPEDDDTLHVFRRSQQQRTRERREWERWQSRWQQRLNIASRLGAREAFSRAIPRNISEHLYSPPNPQPVRERVEQAPTADDRNVRRAWGAFERAREAEPSLAAPPSPNRRKRRARSATASPSEVNQEPERKLKRPRTRRLPTQPEQPASRPTPAPAPRAEALSSGALSPPPPPPNGEGPSFLSSLLKEVEMSTPSDDENAKTNLVIRPAAAADASSPVTPPSPSAYSSPRALSLTPPPIPNGRPSSPPLSLSSHIEPRYRPANYSPNRASSENGDHGGRGDRRPPASPEIRQPRPQRPQPRRASKSLDSSPTRPPLSLEAKENISKIVRSALRPHWHAHELSSDQYSAINQNVSRKLYDEVRDVSSLGEEARKEWERLAVKEVARAVADLKA